MGLDIGYYSNVCLSDKDDENYDDYAAITYNATCFEYQLGSLKINQRYDLTEKSEYDSFRAGSYSGYNWWREQLSIMAGYESANEVWENNNLNTRYLKLNEINGEENVFGPFVELINFSDCEGVIGPEISKKLYKDFVDFDEKAKEYKMDKDYENYFYTKYCEWKEAFRVASDGGLVHFH